MSPLRIRVDSAAFSSAIEYNRDQIPFAVANTLNRCAQEGLAETVRGLPSKFIIRNSWVEKGFRVQFATKSNLVCTISHLDPFMALQEWGGTKEPVSAGNVAIPVGARPTPSATTPQSKWPGRIPRHFFIVKGGVTMEFARTGRKSRKGKSKRSGKGGGARGVKAPGGNDPNLKLMYVLRKSVTIHARLGMVDQVSKTAAERFGINFAGFFAAAIRTAK